MANCPLQSTGAELATYDGKEHDRSWLLRPSLPWATASGQVTISHSGLAASSVKVSSAVFWASMGQQAHVTEKARLTSPLLVAAPGVPLG